MWDQHELKESPSGSHNPSPAWWQQPQEHGRRVMEMLRDWRVGFAMSWGPKDEVETKSSKNTKGSVQLVETQAQAHCCLVLISYKQCNDLELWADLLLRRTQKSIFWLLFWILFNVAEFIYFLTWAIHQRPCYKYYFKKFFLRIAYYNVLPFTYKKKWGKHGLGALIIPYIISSEPLDIQ